MAKAGKHVIGKTTETIGAAAEKIGDTVSQATEPLRKTQAYSSMRDQVKGLVKDDTARYIGYRTKDVRRQQLEEEKLSGGHVHARSVEINPEAGESVILHKDSAWKESWNKFKDGNPVMQSVFRMGQAYNESDHPVFRMTRAVTDRFQDTFGSWFEESENAKTIRIIRQTVEPNFNIEAFMKHAREYIVPEVLDAYLNGDAETLRLWCSEATYNVLTAGIQAQIQQGLVSDSRIMDLRNVEFIAAKLLENDIPVIVISFNTQEVIVFRDRKTGEVVYGKEDHVEQVTYACVLTKQEEDLGNPVTNGWRVMDMAKHGSRPVW
jgi:import inner membrane translocase subunit TIM44